MAEQLKMGLRPKRRPRYRASDEQDPQNASYSRPNYVKMNATSLSHQYISPSVILNQNAKLLVKFVNKVNKDLRDNRLKEEQTQKELIKKDLVPKDRNDAQQMQDNKKHSESSKNHKTQPPKKNKQLYNFKGLHQNSELLKAITQQQMLKGVKGMQNFSGLMNNKSIYSEPLSNQLTQLQSLYPNLKGLDIQALTQSPNPNLFKFNQKYHQQFGTNPQNSPNYLHPSKFIPQQPAESTRHQQVAESIRHQQAAESIRNQQAARQQAARQQPKTAQKEQQKANQKIFKRSAYHVAIAYHIYLKGLYEQGITSGNLIDPTYRARVVKEQVGIGNEEQ